MSTVYATLTQMTNTTTPLHMTSRIMPRSERAFHEMNTNVFVEHLVMRSSITFRLHQLLFFQMQSVQYACLYYTSIVYYRSSFHFCCSICSFINESSKLYVLQLLQMDPFLHLVHENRLQVVKDNTEDPSKSYGSPEDDKNALKSLSAVDLTNSRSRESMVFIIMNSITHLPDVIFHPFFVSISYICVN